MEEAQRLSADIEKNAQPGEDSPDAASQIEAEFDERVKYFATLDSTYRTEKSRLESAISAYQTENLRLESAILELQRQFKELCSRFAQANDHTLQMSHPAAGEERKSR
jgi:prefoldin subunit 5